jgi:hypothetical protein
MVTYAWAKPGMHLQSMRAVRLVGSGLQQGHWTGLAGWWVAQGKVGAWTTCTSFWQQQAATHNSRQLSCNCCLLTRAGPLPWVPARVKRQQ